MQCISKQLILLGSPDYRLQNTFYQTLRDLCILTHSISAEYFAATVKRHYHCFSCHFRCFSPRTALHQGVSHTCVNGIKWIVPQVEHLAFDQSLHFAYNFQCISALQFIYGEHWYRWFLFKARTKQPGTEAYAVHNWIPFTKLRSFHFNRHRDH